MPNNKNLKQYKVIREEVKKGFGEYLAIYDMDGNLIKKGENNHPEGYISLNWNDFEFIHPRGYGGQNKETCYVKITDKIHFETIKSIEGKTYCIINIKSLTEEEANLYDLIKNNPSDENQKQFSQLAENIYSEQDFIKAFNNLDLNPRSHHIHIF